MRNCFNNILIALNVCDSLHLIFAIMDAVRNSFGEKTTEICVDRTRSLGALRVSRINPDFILCADTHTLDKVKPCRTNERFKTFPKIDCFFPKSWKIICLECHKNMTLFFSAILSLGLLTPTHPQFRILYVFPYKGKAQKKEMLNVCVDTYHWWYHDMRGSNMCYDENSLKEKFCKKHPWDSILSFKCQKLLNIENIWKTDGKGRSLLPSISGRNGYQRKSIF